MVDNSTCATVSWSHYVMSTAPTCTIKYTPGYQIDDADARRIRRGMIYDLPDGAKLSVDKDGNYQIDDTDAKVVYRANRYREFSPYLNASDLLASFIEYVGSLGVRKDEVMRLPLQLFVSWLIIEACERDGDIIPPELVPVHQDPAVLQVVKPRCMRCGKFIPRLHQRHRFPFCDPKHASGYLEAAI